MQAGPAPARAPQQSGIAAQQLRSHLVPVVVQARPAAGGGAQRTAVGLVDGGDALGQAGGAVGPHQHAAALVDQFGDGAAGGDHRQAAGHRLQHDQTEGFAIARMNQHVAARQQPRQQPLVTAKRHARDAGMARHLGPAADQQQVIRLAQHAHRVHQQTELFFRGEPPGVDQQPGVGADAQRFAQCGATPARIKHACIDAQRLVDGVVDTDLGQPLHHQPARRQHQVELFVQPRQITPGAAAGHQSEAPLHQPRQVGVIKSHHRHPHRIARPQRRPCAVPRVTHLDQIRPQPPQLPRRPRHRQGHPIPMHPRQGNRRNPDPPIAPTATATANIRTENTMPHPPMPRQPARLGIEVGTHPSPFRRIKHGDVDEMHFNLPKMDKSTISAQSPP